MTDSNIHNIWSTYLLQKVILVIRSDSELFSGIATKISANLGSKKIPLLFHLLVGICIDKFEMNVTCANLDDSFQFIYRQYDGFPGIFCVLDRFF